MPLSAALQARLAKRGLLQAGHALREPEEEIIAEDYDDQMHTNDVDELHAKEKRKYPDEVAAYIERLRKRMLKKHPLPEKWEEIYDCGTGRHYYWHSETDEVSWLSPTHPKAKIGPSAAKLRPILDSDDEETFGFDEDYPSDELETDSDDNDNDSESDSDNENPADRLPVRPVIAHNLDSGWNKKYVGVNKQFLRAETETGPKNIPVDFDVAKIANLVHTPRRKKHKDNDLDPMDPASYSEIARGSWSTGLEGKGEAKTGVDSTASGPLFQMRPYPSPGAILRANASNQK
ncbi:Polyglutamine-binding protein 1 [Nymphon striatum]|nr:Polyglutamine-binding protein 1 [Nymphon striatum]